MSADEYNAVAAVLTQAGYALTGGEQTRDGRRTVVWTRGPTGDLAVADVVRLTFRRDKADW